MDEWEKKINSFQNEERHQALLEVQKEYSAFNMHCHSFYSYNGYGYSPSMLVALAKKLRWRGVMLVDFDVLDGVDEFLQSARCLGVKCAAGMESRVFIPELANVEINSPGEPGIAYHLGVGFASSSVPKSAEPFARQLRHKANERTKNLVARVNEFLSEIAIDFDDVASKFTPNGNVTERHVCAAYREAAEKKFAGAALQEYWQGKLGKFESAPVKLEGIIRSKTMKRGGIGYVQPTPESFPTLAEMNKFITDCGAVPTLAWLNGLSAGEQQLEQLLELHVRYGCRAATLIPDRNWRNSDPEKAAQLQKELDRFVNVSQKYHLPLLAGTEMNAPGQLLADDFTVPALWKHYEIFASGADAFLK